MMTEALLFNALLAFGPHCSSSQARAIAAVALPAARRRGLDPLLLAAVALHETGRTCRHAVRHERVGGCSIGPFQVYHRDCAEGRRLYTRLHAAAYRAAKILWLGKMRCRATVGAPRYCHEGRWWGRYNAGSKRWRVAVGKLWQRLRAWAAAREESHEQRSVS